MLWLDTSPQSMDIPLLDDNQKIIKLFEIDANHFGMLTTTKIIVYNKHPLVCVTSFNRSPESLETHGINVDVKIGSNSTIFVQTQMDFLILLNLVMTSKEIFQVFRGDGEFLQNGFPVVEQYSFFSSLMPNSKNTSTRNHELAINEGYLNVLKIIKISMGIEKYWVKQHSHNIIVFNRDLLQIVNYKTLKSEVFELTRSKWYEGDEKRIVDIEFNELGNYFMFVNEDLEVWFIFFNLLNTEILTGWKVFDLDREVSSTTEVDVHEVGISKDSLPAIKINFNPKLDLIAVSINEKIQLLRIHKLYRLNTTYLEYVKDLQLPTSSPFSFTWSCCGTSFILVDETTNYWYFHSKFGNCKFNSEEFHRYYMLKDEDETTTSTQDSENWFTINHVLFLSTDNLLLVSKETNQLFNFGLLYSNCLINQTVNNLSNPLLNNYNYLLTTNSTTTSNSYKVALPYQFQNKMKITEELNSVNQVNTRRLKFCINEANNQVVLSNDARLSVYKNTPTMNKWFDYVNDYMDSLVIKAVFWFKDYLIVLNSNDEKKDELIIFNKFNLNNNGITLNSESIFNNDSINGDFNSDLIVWRYDFSKIISFDLCDEDFSKRRRSSTASESGGSSTFKNKLVLVTEDYKLVIIQLDIIRGQLNVNISKFIHLKSLEDKLEILNIVQIHIIEQHFLILLNTGELYILKNFNDSSGNERSWYELIKISNCVEYFNFVSKGLINRLLYYFDGDNILIDSLNELIEGLHSRIEEPEEMSSFSTNSPLKINVNGYYPLFISNNNYKSFNLTGLEADIISKNHYLILRNKVVNKVILNNLIEKELSKIDESDIADTTTSSIYNIYLNYKNFKNFSYCLELLLFKYLAEESETETETIKNELFLTKLNQLIKLAPKPELIYVNCLRKIELKYWSNFFKLIGLTPQEFMKDLLKLGNSEICYNYLIVYLSYKSSGGGGEVLIQDEKLDDDDKLLITKNFHMLKNDNRYELCFELCRFIKLLESSDELLESLLNDLK